MTQFMKLLLAGTITVHADGDRRNWNGGRCRA